MTCSFSFLGSILGLGIIVLYILMNIGLIVYFRRSYRDEFSPVRHALLPVSAACSCCCRSTASYGRSRHGPTTWFPT